jgi:hypothetical protein
MPSRHSVIRVGLGVLLVAAAGLKLYGLGVSAVPRVGWFSQPWVQLLTAEWELVLGLWLISGAAPRLSWLAALVTFAAFAAVSGYLGWVGVASCGCFGAVEASPWWAFGVDVAAVALLAVGRPAGQPPAPHFLRAAGLWAGGVALACGLLAAAGSLFFGSVEAAVAKLRGETVTVSPAYVDFGAGRPGERLEATVTATNYTGEPVRLIGGTTDCGCATLDDFPIAIPPGGKANFRIRLTVIGSGGRLTRNVMVRTDCPERPVVRFRIACRVVE